MVGDPMTNELCGQLARLMGWRYHATFHFWMAANGKKMSAPGYTPEFAECVKAHLRALGLGYTISWCTIAKEWEAMIWSEDDSAMGEAGHETTSTESEYHVIIDAALAALEGENA